MTTLTKRFEDALHYAINVHANQKRKGTEIPYVSHLISVASIVLEHEGTENEAIAALLHDAAEDQGGQKRLDEIRLQFGAETADIVQGCSETMVRPKPEWKVRKDGYIAHIADAPKSVQFVSAADKLDNVRSILSTYNEVGEELWGRFNAGRDDQLWYYRSLVTEFNKAGSNRLIEDLDRAVRKLEASVNQRAKG